MRMFIRHHWDGRIARAIRALTLSATGRALLTGAHARRLSCQFVMDLGGGPLGTFDHATQCCDIRDDIDEAAVPLVLAELISRGLEQEAPGRLAWPDEAHWTELVVAREMAEAGVAGPLAWYMRAPGDVGNRLRRASMVMLSAELVGRDANDAPSLMDDLRQAG